MKTLAVSRGDRKRKFMLEEYERKRFAGWLSQQIADNNTLVGQFEKLNMPPHAVKVLTDDFKRKNVAYSIVLHDLVSAETITTGPG